MKPSTRRLDGILACILVVLPFTFLRAEDPASKASGGTFSPRPPAASEESAPLPPPPERYGWPALLKADAGGTGPLELAPAASDLSDRAFFLMDPILNDDLLVFYGSPLSPRMGILGRFSMDELDSRLTELAAEYDAVNGARGVRKAFYLIYGTCWPEGEIGILSSKKTAEWIEFARARGILVFLDHQIGKYSVAQAMAALLPWLRYPNVHLAIDPEWRTTKPMKEIGYITGEELNEAQRIMSGYMKDHGISGSRIFVVHEFNGKMVRGKEAVRADWDGVTLVHCADGFGPPAVKYDSYKRNVDLGPNLPLKGFKLFYSWGVPGAGFDSPLLGPAQVMGLSPAPTLIMYQ